jgi:hypothetical protein
MLFSGRGLLSMINLEEEEFWFLWLALVGKSQVEDRGQEISKILTLRLSQCLEFKVLSMPRFILWDIVYRALQSPYVNLQLFIWNSSLTISPFLFLFFYRVTFLAYYIVFLFIMLTFKITKHASLNMNSTNA